MPEDERIAAKKSILGPENADNFVLFWVNRNAKRKRPNDVLMSWKLFLDKLLPAQRKTATLVMHTDPKDQEGPDLIATANKLGIMDTIKFSKERIGFEQMNMLHNISDACINIAFAEGFGLATLESMKVGNPIIATKTGGLTRQVVDHRDGSENGVALDVKVKSLVGSQNVPYIYEDYSDVNDAADAIHKLFCMPKEERAELGLKARAYVQSEFALQDTVDEWHNTLLKLVEDWKSGKRVVPRYQIKEV